MDTACSPQAVRRRRRAHTALLKGGSIVTFFVCAFLTRVPPSSRGRAEPYVSARAEGGRRRGTSRMDTIIPPVDVESEVRCLTDTRPEPPRNSFPVSPSSVWGW